MSRTEGVIVGIEKNRIGGIELAIAALLLQDERLEKPGGVRTMPFYRACIRHRLQILVLGGERLRKLFRRTPNGEISLEQR